MPFQLLAFHGVPDGSDHVVSVLGRAKKMGSVVGESVDHQENPQAAGFSRGSKDRIRKKGKSQGQDATNSEKGFLEHGDFPVKAKVIQLDRVKRKADTVIPFYLFVIHNSLRNKML